jgi:hypothetical protein
MIIFCLIKWLPHPLSLRMLWDQTCSCTLWIRVWSPLHCPSMVLFYPLFYICPSIILQSINTASFYSFPYLCVPVWFSLLSSLSLLSSTLFYISLSLIIERVFWMLLFFFHSLLLFRVDFSFLYFLSLSLICSYLLLDHYSAASLLFLLIYNPLPP